MGNLLYSTVANIMMMIVKKDDKYFVMSVSDISVTNIKILIIATLFAAALSGGMFSR